MTKGRSGLCLDLLFLELPGPRKLKAGRQVVRRGWEKDNGGYTPREEMCPFWKASRTLSLGPPEKGTTPVRRGEEKLGQHFPTETSSSI